MMRVKMRDSKTGEVLEPVETIKITDEQNLETGTKIVLGENQFTELIQVIDNGFRDIASAIRALK